MAFVAVAAGVGALASGYKVYDSAKKSSQANKLAENNKRPFYKSPEEIDDVYNVALSEVNNTQEQSLVTQELEQNASAGIDAVLKSGGRADFGVINGTFGNQMRAALQSLYRNRDARIAAANNAAYNLAKAKDAEFQYNNDAPYKDKKQAEAVLRQQSEQSKNEGISGAISTVSNLAIASTKPGNYGGGLVDLGGEGQGRMPIDVIELPTPTAPAPTRRIGDRPINAPAPAALSNNDGYYDETQNGWRTDGGNNIIVRFDEFGQPVYKN